MTNSTRSSSPTGSPARTAVTPGRRGAIMALALLIGILVWSFVAHRNDGGTVDMLKGLPRDAIVASDTAGPEAGRRWLVTSGTLFSRHGELWSGVPDAGPPDPIHGRTGSAVLRAVTTRTDYEDVRVQVEMRLNALHSTARTGKRSWDGVHVFLRYRNAQNLYVVDLVRRDGLVTIKRKAPPVGSAAHDTVDSTTAARETGAYTLLATARLEPTTTWHSFDLGIRNTPASVLITLAVDGRTLLTTIDTDRSAPLHGPGRVGIRGDNADFLIRRFIIRPVG
jgi:hypothetical protein